MGGGGDCIQDCTRPSQNSTCTARCDRSSSRSLSRIETGGGAISTTQDLLFLLMLDVVVVVIVVIEIVIVIEILE